MSKIEIKTANEFKEFCETLRASEGYKDPIAFGIARVDKGQLDQDKILQASYAAVSFKENFLSAAAIIWALSEDGISVDFNGSEFVAEFSQRAAKKAWKLLGVFKDEMQTHKNVEVVYNVKHALEEQKNVGKFRVVFIFEDTKPLSVEVVYLKLYLLSLQKAPLRSLVLDGAFGVLPNVAWDANSKPIELEWLRQNEVNLKMNGEYPTIVSVDKFPRYLSHIIPCDNTRILDSAKVRMGALISAGTTVMPGAAYVNFNAGTTGSVMIEGRVSSSVVVGEGSDIGGGASILGVLSGTNGNPVSIGKNCLLGANSVTGIPLGDKCIVDAGIAVLEGTKVYISKEERGKLALINPEFKFEKEIYKGLELSGVSGLHFRQNSQTGQITASASKRAIKLNEALH
ncbi:tetrahydrodipicolinate N-succinyltransferase N-terminal domain-containing protein [Campylobacter sp. RM9344]|uniref:Tetrahydrodipicolinate N-succinyltransferase N-terminal domain-containing protein n=1 Tax=Campylobacter californiensis TaxID=1032243 RepID=A0AAW3ZY94_9BACT|nr:MULTISPECIES: tetrahydrodipicolinate N-succinyltransferase N-terminal domain-containing protein [unclassified Campylobacter]MBE2984865.1 tetrahydrodipicolinate N-succinyltransferase N-terminal domain-containing protein [Campylobacter sp. RM6883]MBE2995359.1 tetrahydrodipicolinate N-succinyltransferase N-terminal domain-containing protein [Campylobacter sp. RM6913]MBE3029306.1 tetrahydrodipicolinate N-succinyltransferase N-terminal domain-containing protein [Campylobacter sp. RM9344]MBE360653